MNIRGIIVFVLVLFSISGSAQNLVPNGSFEEIEQCPYNQSHFRHVKYWLPTGYYPLNQGSSEELFHTCGTNGFNIPNTGHGTRYARTGNSMAALVFYSKLIQGGLSEQIEVQLKSPMESGKEYCMSYFVRSVTGRPTFGVCIQEVTATFSKDTLKQEAAMPATYLPKPQVINRNGIIKDTVNWTRITGNFTATGGEKFLTIYGYFPEDSVTLFSYNPDSKAAYYFIDDVAVWECSTPVYEADAGNDQMVCVGDKIQLGTHDYNDYQYYWFEKGNLQDTLASIARPEFTPNKTTEYVLQVIDFKYDKSWDTVLVGIDKDCIRFGKIPNVFTPNGDGYNDRFVPQHPDDISYEIVILNRWGKKVFTGDQDHTWDGTINSQKAAAGTYYYVIAATHQSEEASQQFSGSVTLLY